MGPTTSADNQVGQLLAGRYRLARLLTSGSTAEIWEGVDEVLDRPIAVKLLHRELADDPAVVERFRAEGIAVARVQHEAIAPVYDTCSEPGIEAIVMERAAGRSLDAILLQRGPLGVATAVRVTIAVAAALEAAHDIGVVHGDVAPKNILVRREGTVKLTGFGSSRLDNVDLSRDPEATGLTVHLAPEQIDGRDVDARADVYALGLVLYELLAGTGPFEGDNDRATALARLHRKPTPLRARRADVPKPVEAVVMTALAPDPDDRYATMAELRTALQAAPTEPEPPRRRLRFGPGERRWLLPLGAVVLLALGAGVIAVALAGGRDGGPTTTTAPASGEAAGPESASEAAGTTAESDAGTTSVDDDPAPEPPARSATTIAPIGITATSAFDPLGDGRESDSLVALVADGDPATEWRTERYDTPQFGNLKGGVGVVALLDEPATISEVALSTPSVGWAAEIYVADDVAEGIDEWGEPVASAAGIDGDVTFAMADTVGRAVLVWITDLGSDRVHIAEITVEGVGDPTGG